MLTIRRLATTVAATLLACSTAQAAQAAQATDTDPASATTAEDKAWEANYDARQAWYEKQFGPLPENIMKMMNMVGVWPGGGLYVVPASKLGPDKTVYTTFGLSNIGMPTQLRSEVSVEAEDDGRGGQRASSARTTLTRKEPAASRPGAAGYGYELIVIARPADESWALNLLQWAVTMELKDDIDLLGRVEKYDGLTAERIGVGKGQMVNVLIAKASPPLPQAAQLPAGRMELLVATTITEDEMKWALKHGRGALLKRLLASGVGQVSDRGRPGVVP